MKADVLPRTRAPAQGEGLATPSGAEEIETPGQLRRLRELGCDDGQGDVPAGWSQPSRVPCSSTRTVISG